MNGKVHCVIMGGGRGTRLYPLTKLRCKPAVPLAGKYRLVDIPISNCINSGYNRIYLLSQFNTASLHRHVQDVYRFDRFGQGFVEILSAEQTEHGDNWYQGTADAVRRNLIHFGADDEDLCVILSGDQLYRMDFQKWSRSIYRVQQLRLRQTCSGRSLGFWDCCGLETNQKLLILLKSLPTKVISRLIPPELKANGTEPDRCLTSIGIYFQYQFDV